MEVESFSSEVVFSLMEALVVDTLLSAGKALGFLLMLTGSMLNDLNSSPNLTLKEERFPFEELHKKNQPGPENEDASDTNDNDENDDDEDDDDDDDADDPEDDAGDEDFSGEEGEDEEGDPEENPATNGQGGSDDDDNGDDDDEGDDDDDDGEDDDEDEDEDEDEEVPQPPTKKRK